MTNRDSRIRFKAKLLQPATPARGNPWAFLVLPESASSRLPTRGMTTVDGTINGYPFKATLEPDGERCHWLKVNRKMRDAAGAAAGDVVILELTPAVVDPDPKVPPDLRKALAAAPKARALWSEITPKARTDWVQWIISAKKPETRARRVMNACKMLASGKRRVCCFDRSGFFGGNFCAPEAAASPNAKKK
jgi:Bacteriocin-protection, YdeI or OmpD-Associated/Domain of unknown function (DUF1905)